MAVYTPLTPDELRAYAERFALGELRHFEGIAAGTINTIYRLKTDHGDFILRILEDHLRKDALFEQQVLRHLHRHGLPVALMRADTAGEVIVTLGERQHLSVCDYLPGRDLRPDEVNADHCRQVGAFLAAMHRAGVLLEAERDNPYGPEKIAARIAYCREETTDEEVATALAELAQQRHAYPWPRALPIGLLHNDLFIDNVRFENGELCGVIDFEMASTGPLAYDLAIALMDWAFAPGYFDTELGRALCAGYQAERKLTAKERAAFFTLCHCVAVRFTTTRIHDFEIHKRPEAERRYKNFREYRARLAALDAFSEQAFLDALGLVDDD